MTNEFLAKKLGEVGAFAGLGKDTISRGHEAMTSMMGEDTLKQRETFYETLLQDIDAFAKQENVEGITLPKQEATLTKLKEMRDLYVKDAWDNPIELAEWSGFYIGAAIVHLRLVLGGAKNTGAKELQQLAEKAISFYETYYEEIGAYLENVGKEKSG